VAPIRLDDDELEERLEMLEKAEREHLSVSQAEALSKAMAATFSRRRRRWLLDNPFEWETHTEKAVKLREAEYGPFYDPLWMDMPEDAEWQLAKESQWVARDSFREPQGIIEKMREAANLGKLPEPDGHPWLAANLREFAGEVLAWADDLKRS
jgi:hypothetical protein